MRKFVFTNQFYEALLKSLQHQESLGLLE